MTFKATYAPLGSLCKTSSGGTPLKARKEYYEGGTIPWLLSGEVAQGNIWNAENFITQKGLENSSAKIFPVNTVLVAMYGATAGEVGLLRIEAATNQAVCGILPNKHFVPEYLYYFFLFKKKELVGKAVGNAQPNISQAKIKETIVPLVDLKEQVHIVNILDEAFERVEKIRANVEANIKKSRELFDRALQASLTNRQDDWTDHVLSDVCGIPSKLVDPREEQYLDLPHVGAGNIESKTAALIEVKTAREEQLISGKFLFDNTMVLYSKIRPYLMKVVRPDFNGLCSADIYPLAPKLTEISRDYLFYLLLTSQFTDYAIRGSARAGMPKVNRDHLFAYEFSLPPIAEQNHKTANLDSLAFETQRLIEIYERKLEVIAELKMSLLEQAFKGGLSPEITAEEVEAVA